MKAFSWHSGQDKSRTVVVPQGFVFTLDQVPNLFWSLVRPDEQILLPLILHEYLYWTQETTREEADQILREAMAELSSATTAAVIYQAVRSFGDGAWKNMAKRRAAGERRILTKFPEDPSVTWTDWRRREGVLQ